MAIAIELDRVVIRGYFKWGGCIVGAEGCGKVGLIYTTLWLSSLIDGNTFTTVLSHCMCRKMSRIYAVSQEILIARAGSWKN